MILIKIGMVIFEAYIAYESVFSVTENNSGDLRWSALKIRENPGNFVCRFLSPPWNMDDDVTEEVFKNFRWRYTGNRFIFHICILYLYKKVYIQWYMYCGDNPIRTIVSPEEDEWLCEEKIVAQCGADLMKSLKPSILWLISDSCHNRAKVKLLS